MHFFKELNRILMVLEKNIVYTGIDLIKGKVIKYEADHFIVSAGKFGYQNKNRNKNRNQIEINTK